MERFIGRPEDLAGRLPKEVRVYDLLDQLGIHYERVDHEAIYTMEACREIDQVLGVDMNKNLFLCNKKKTRHYLLMLPGDKVYKAKDLTRQHELGRLSFADSDKMEEYLDIWPGALSVMGLMNDKEGNVGLLIDEELLQEPYIGCHASVNTASIRLKTEDLLEKFLPATGHEPLFVKL